MFIHEQTYADLTAELEQLRRTAELSGQINANLRTALAKSKRDADDMRCKLYRAQCDLEGERARAARVQRSKEQIAGDLHETCRQLDTAVAERKKLKRELRRERRLFELLRDDYHTLFYRATDESGERETWKACAEEREKEVAELRQELQELGTELAEREDAHVKLQGQLDEREDAHVKLQEQLDEREDDVRHLKKAAVGASEELRKARAELDAARPVAQEVEGWGGSPKLSGIGWVDLRPVDRRKLSIGEKAHIVAELRRRYTNDVFSVGKHMEVCVHGNNHLWLEVVSMGGLAQTGTTWTHMRLRDDVILTIV